uniref:TFIIS N-terminal domain-containing protein n=1 Tax=Plectus sambesii TaxID=2011161 RepID=A0A914UW82_9BILA
MDKFLVRTPRVSSVKKCRSPVKKKLKQAKLESLKGVVVIEQIIATKQILKDTTQDADVLLARLTELSNKLPAVEVLKTTGIGRTVKALYKHDDARVAAAAQRVVQQWTDHIKYIKTRPELEVQVGAAAQAMRDKAKHFLTEAFRSQQ